MKKYIALIICVCISCLCLTACSGKETASSTSGAADAGTQQQTTTSAAVSGNDTALVGNWQESIFDTGFIFNADGTGTDTFWDLTFTYETDNGEVLIIYDTDEYGASKYTYTVSGTTLSMTRIDEEETSTFTYTKVD